MQGHFYILSNDYLPNDEREYKVGHHTKSIEELRSRYITPIPKLHIHMFISEPHSVLLESYVLEHFYDNRIINHGNSNIQSEWIKQPLNVIRKYVYELHLQFMTCNDISELVMPDHQSLYYKASKRYLMKMSNNISAIKKTCEVLIALIDANKHKLSTNRCIVYAYLIYNHLNTHQLMDIGITSETEDVYAKYLGLK